MKKKAEKILSVLTNSQKEIFGLGDYLRIISFLPNLKYDKIFWISDKKIYPIVKQSDRIDKFIDIKNPIRNFFLNKSDLVLNLFEKKNSTKKIVYMQELFTNEGNIKQKTLNLYQELSDKFNMKDYEIFSNKKNNYKTSNDIFINWVTPKMWKIKSYPIKLLKNLENNLKTKKFKKIIWQSEDDTFNNYAKKIKEAKIIVSIIGLGCHLAMMFNKPLIVLAGPTYFNELDKYKKAKVIFPEHPCKWRPCNLRTGVDNCGCMGDINYVKIYEKINLIKNV